MTIGDRIRQERIDQDVSVEALARAAGLKPSTLYDLERGASKTTTRLHRIADYLKVTTGWLETGKGQKNSAVSDIAGNYRVEPVSNGAAQPLHDSLPRNLRVRVRGTVMAVTEGSWFKLDAAGDDDYCVERTVDPDGFAVRIKGSGFHPVISSGEAILVEPNTPPAPGRKVLVTRADGYMSIMHFQWSRGDESELLAFDGRTSFTVTQGDGATVQTIQAIFTPKGQ